MGKSFLSGDVLWQSIRRALVKYSVLCAKQEKSSNLFAKALVFSALP